MTWPSPPQPGQHDREQGASGHPQQHRPEWGEGRQWQTPPGAHAPGGGTQPARSGIWAPIAVSALTVLVAALGVSGSFMDLVRVRRTYGEGDDASTYVYAETGWEGVYRTFGSSAQEDGYSVVRVGIVVVIAIALLALGSALSFVRAVRGAGLALAATGAGLAVAAALLPVLGLSATLANDDGGDGVTAYSFRADLGPGGYLLIATGVLAGIAALVAVAGAAAASRPPTTRTASGPQHPDRARWAG